MKNKKMVATIASLCLVVVAVVAAVVGVLAAVTQYTDATFKVTYVAKNVYADVELKSMGPQPTMSGQSVTGRTLINSWEEVTHQDNSQTVYDGRAHFAPTDKTAVPGTASAYTDRTIANLTAKSYDFGWNDANGGSSATFYGVALYQFKFINLSLENTLDISFEYLAPTDSDNIELKFYKSTENLAWSDIKHAEWASNGQLSTDFGLSKEVDNTETVSSITTTTKSGAATFKEGTVASAASSSSVATNNGTIYVYLLLGVKDATKSGSFEFNNTGKFLTFTMVANAPSA